MLLSNMPQHKISFGIYKRPDGEEFTIDTTLYESPANYNYWLVHFYVTHATWGSIRYRLHIPKQIASTVVLANALIGAGPLSQVKSFLNDVSVGGKVAVYCESADGWLLV